MPYQLDPMSPLVRKKLNGHLKAKVDEQWMGKKKKKMEWVNALRKNVTLSFVASRRQ